MSDFQKYVQRYLNMIPSQDWIAELKNAGNETLDVFSNLTEEQSFFAYDEGKWSLKELLLHLIDTERVFQYRLLCVARGEPNKLPGFDEDLYAQNSFANSRSLESLVHEFQLVRSSSQILVENLSSSALKNIGNANGNDLSAETIGKLIVGHNIHHLNIVKERYLSKL